MRQAELAMPSEREAAAEPQRKPVLSVKGLAVGYPTPSGWTTPVNGLDFVINQHEIVGLVGDAGSGKSTAALAMLNLTRPPGRILAGSIDFDGRNLVDLPEAELREIRGRDIGIIVQNPRSALNPMLKIGRQIGYAYQAHQRAGAAQARDRAIEMLRMVGINDPERRIDSFAHELSGGMAQRALIAMALSSRPKLLIADEPTSGLDVTIQAQFLDQMWTTAQETGSAVLLVTQELGVIANYCDRVLVLHDGRIVEDAPVERFFSDPQHPYSRDVLRMQRERGSSFRAFGGTSESIVRTESLTKHFPVRNSDKMVQAVDKVTFDVKAGEAVGLVGESGSGKTTVGRCLTRLLDNTSGRIMFGDTDLSTLTVRQMRSFRSKIQIVFQDPFDSLNPRWTIGEILSEPLNLHRRMSRAEKRREAGQHLELVGLDPVLLDRKPRGLGAGTLQRINIARAIICKPEFIVLDEPTSVLAPRPRAGLIELLARLQDELGVSYLFISHDLTTVRYLCHRVAVMYLGQIVEEGTVEQVFTAPQHPYSRALLSAHLFPDPAHRRVDNPVEAALEGEIPSPIDPPHGCYLSSRCPFAKPECSANPQVLTRLEDGRSVRCQRSVAGEI